ncbi:MAG: BlaI/MecI/CopY family transcriptional regulator [Lachnospiraceae bacterium]|nr:BlaI/MecI/CopY family transcriptional regulator [Lachnospiraceae bacterium]
MEKIFESEYLFLCLLWEKEPVASPELVKLCEKQFGWKKSTTYTVIRKLSDKGIIRNEKTVVESLVSKEEVDRQAGDELLERTAKGNIPSFLATFLKDRQLTREEAEHIKKMIDESCR